jgi:hypothetical protein
MRWLLLGLGGLLACRAASGRPPAADGTLEASWRDSTGTAQLSAPAEARWCARDTLLELIAARNDTVVGLALFARDSLKTEGFPLFQPSIFAPWRPQATAALRVFNENTLRNFQSMWGKVELTEVSGNRVSGTFDAHLKNLTGPDSLHLTGRFTRVPVRSATGICGRENKPAAG